MTDDVDGNPDRGVVHHQGSDTVRVIARRPLARWRRYAAVGGAIGLALVPVQIALMVLAGRPVTMEWLAGETLLGLGGGALTALTWRVVLAAAPK